MMTYTTSPEHILETFVVDNGALFRRLAKGALSSVTSLQGGQLCVKVFGERIKAMDIAWCLYYGNWPSYLLTLLDGNPHNVSMDNIMPVRVKQLRCRLEHDSRGWRHSLSKQIFASEAQARKNWTVFAREHYSRDLAYIIELERVDRERRLATLAAQPALRPAPLKHRPRGLAFGTGQPSPAGKPRKPEKISGRVWHWVKTEWVSLPESCHVADDWHVRLRKQRAGAVRFEFQPEWQEVWGFREDGSVVL